MSCVWHFNACTVHPTAAHSWCIWLLLANVPCLPLTFTSCRLHSCVCAVQACSTLPDAFIFSWCAKGWKGTLVSLRPTSCRQCLHDWNPAPASWATSATVKNRATSRTVKSRAISLTCGGNVTPGLCWKAFSSMIGTKQPLTYGRKQRLSCYSTAQQLRRRLACHESKPDQAYALRCVKIVKNKHDHLPNVRASWKGNGSNAYRAKPRPAGQCFFRSGRQYPEALPLELLPFEPKGTTSDSSRPKRRKMYSIPLESEEMEESDLEATTEEFGVGTGSNPGGAVYFLS